MTPEKIQLFRLEKRDRMSLVQSAKQAKWDEAQREEEKREEKKLKSTEGARKQAAVLWKKHFKPHNFNWEKRGSTVEKQRTKKLTFELSSLFKDRRTRDERDEDRELKAMPRTDMDILQEYEAEVNEIDSLMYIPVDWGRDGSPDNKRRRMIGHRAKPRV